MTQVFCYLCGRPIQYNLEKDHVIAKSRDGSTTSDNLRDTHRECNRMKGNLTLAEFIFLIERIHGHLVARLKGDAINTKKRGPKRECAGRPFKQNATDAVKVFVDQHEGFSLKQILDEPSISTKCSRATVVRRIAELCKQKYIARSGRGYYLAVSEWNE